jgi:hypothetical protein
MPDPPPQRPHQYDYIGLSALILSIGLVATIIILAVETSLHPGSISDTEATVLSTVLGAIVGAIATYLGVSLKNSNGGKE